MSFITEYLMNKCFIYLMLSLLSFGLISCEDKEEVHALDLNLLDGVWEVVDECTQDNLGRGCLLDMSISTDHAEEAYGGYNGSAVTYYLTVGGRPLQDKVYCWSILRLENNLPLLELILQDELESDDLWDGYYIYRITKLTDRHMWWQLISNGNNTTIKFRHRADVISVGSNEGSF